MSAELTYYNIYTLKKKTNKQTLYEFVLDLFTKFCSYLSMERLLQALFARFAKSS